MEKLGKKFVGLLSGGLDSPVASYVMMKQGFSGIVISFQTAEDPEKQNREKIEKICQHLCNLTGQALTLYYIPYTEIQDEFIKYAARKLTCLLCKRLMLRIASKVAQDNKISFILNGDILGEQASQTLDNLYAVQNVIQDVFVLRPLIGFEKLGVIHLAQDIGTYPLSSLPAPGCTKNPKYPETHAKLKELKKAENNFNYEKIVPELISKAEIVAFHPSKESLAEEN